MKPGRDVLVAVTGATGYVGGRLVPLLLERGYRVRALARSLEKLACRPFASHPRCEPVRADALDPASLRPALEGCQAAFYLIHSMNRGARRPGADFVDVDRAAALNFAHACAEDHVGRIIYLGGLGDEEADLSLHLRSRLKTAQILASGPVPLTFLRAAIILGAGGASFEIIRPLVERLPVLFSPRWVRTRCQPISIRDVLEYLAGCLEHPETMSRTFDIGGPDILTYQDLFQIYAQEAGLRKRLIIPLPFFTTGLSTWLLRLITPVPPSVVAPLVAGLKNEVVCRETTIREIIPVRLQSCRETFRAARRELKDRLVPTCWADAGLVQPPEWLVCGDAPYAGGPVYEMGFAARLGRPPEEVWPAVESIGGERGWYFANFLWEARGLLDRIAGGVGLGPGRRNPSCLLHGDSLDCWRVWACDPPGKLILLAAMKTPGEAALELTLESAPGGASEITLLARFQPRGLAGLLYWYAMFAPHLVLFAGLLRGLARAAGADVLEGPRRFTPAVPGQCPPRGGG